MELEGVSPMSQTIGSVWLEVIVDAHLVIPFFLRRLLVASKGSSGGESKHANHRASEHGEP